MGVVVLGRVVMRGGVVIRGNVSGDEEWGWGNGGDEGWDVVIRGKEGGLSGDNECDGG